jgi:actin-related protein
MTLGFDCGTYNLVSCKRNEKGDFTYRKEINAFLEMPTDNPFLFNMMKKSGVPLIQREDAKVAYALGEAAMNMAYTMPQIEVKRPMKDGCVNPKEKDAFQIMSIMIHSLIGEIDKDKTLLYYSVPANAINEETDADYHSKVLEAIFKAYKSSKGFTVDSRPINEALALVYAELADKSYTGVSASFGGGMVNVTFSLYAAPVFKFAIVNSGDWIDKQAAKATGETVAFINREKHKIDLSKSASNMVERAIQTQYNLMIEKTVMGIKKGIEENSKAARVENPVDFIIAGGTASPPGFDKLFKDVLSTVKLPIPIGNIIRPKDPLLSVCKGCLIAAENASV